MREEEKITEEGFYVPPGRGAFQSPIASTRSLRVAKKSLAHYLFVVLRHYRALPFDEPAFVSALPNPQHPLWQPVVRQDHGVVEEQERKPAYSRLGG